MQGALLRLWCVLVVGLSGLGMVALVWGGAGTGVTLAQGHQGPPVQQERWSIDRVVDWQAGAGENVLVSNNAGGELRLDVDATSGMFVSWPMSATFQLNAAGAYWRADEPVGTRMRLQLRGRSTPPPAEDAATTTDDEPTADDAGWGPWQDLVAADARSRVEDGALAMPDVLEFPPDTRYLQFRALFESDTPNASPVLNEITVVYMNTMAGPTAAPGMPRVPIFFGPDTLTPRPMLIMRSAWSAQRVAAQPDYATPRGIVIHAIAVPPAPAERNPLAMLRALATYQTDTLGWDDMAYHYLIDEQGTLYEGRLGGPVSRVPRLAAGDDAVHVALISNPDTELTDESRGTLTYLLAWLCEAYHIDPLGEHMVLADGEPVARDNIVGHAEIVPAAPDPGEPLRDMLPEFRTSVDESLVQSRWYFPEGNVAEYEQRLMFFNPGPTTAIADVTLLQGEDATPLVRPVTVPAGGHADLVVNEVLSSTMSLSAMVDSSEPILVERSMAFASDINANAGINRLSRIWYFAEGSTDGNFETYLVLLNPHALPVDATITYMKGDGIPAQQQAHIEPRRRLVVTVKDALPGVGFGVRIIANRPIAAERTMRFGPNREGMHIGAGTSKLSRAWYFAEGTTDPPFEMRFLILNPNDQGSNTTVTFMTPDGTSLTRRYAIPPTTRLVVDVNEVVPALGVATRVESDRPLAVERSLYFSSEGLANGDNEADAEDTTSDTAPITETEEISPTDVIANAGPDAGTVSFGATEPAYLWRFAYGQTVGMRYYVLISNPSRGQAQVTMDAVLSDGRTRTQNIVMPGGSRYTVAVHELFPEEEAISLTVRSTQRIVAERSLFAVGSGRGGSTSLGVPGD